MKASELRIGNLISIYDVGQSKWFDLQGEQRDFGRFEFGENKSLVPIPLTEQWLERFGFRKSIIGDAVKIAVWGIEIENQSQKFNLVRNLADGGYVLSNELNFWSSPIIYVHQLQNLYFALTGEELTIK